MGGGRIGAAAQIVLVLLVAFARVTAKAPAAAKAAAVEFFVSGAGGTDSGMGTSASAPFASLGRAKAAASARLAAGDSVTVSLLAGQFRLNSTLTFSAADGPTDPGQTCTWRAHPSNDGPATITGSKEVPWSSFAVSQDPRIHASARGKVLVGSLVGAGIANFGGGIGWDFELGDRLEVFVGGETMTLARYPNKDERPQGSAFVGFAQMSAGLGRNASAPGKINAISWSGEGAAGMTTERARRWDSTGGLESLALHGTWKYMWADEMIPVDHIDVANMSFVFGTESEGQAYWPPGKGNPYFAVNLLHELDVAGEWWLDRKSGQLFIYPPPNPGPLEVSVPIAMPAAVSAVIGEYGPVLVYFEGLGNVTWDRIGMGKARGVALLAVNSSNLQLQGVNVSGMAFSAARIINGSNVTLQRWDVRAIGNGGILLEGGDRPTLTPCNHRLLDSEITDTGNWAMYNVQPVTTMGVGTLVAHNYIHDVGAHAFFHEGNDHIIEYNLVERVLLRCWDCGAYHVGRDLTWRGNILRYNVNINDDKTSADAFPCIKASTSCMKAAYYMDDHYSGTVTHGNVVVGYENGVFIHFGRDNVMTSNLFIGTNISIAVEDCQPIKADAWCDLPLSDPNTGDTLITSLKAAMEWPLWSTLWMERYPALRNVTWHPGATLNNTVDANIVIGADGNATIWNANTMPGGYMLPGPTDVGPPVAPSAAQLGWTSDAGIAAAGFVAADPIGGLDFSLAPGSAALKALGERWEQIPAGQGPRPAAALKGDDDAATPGTKAMVTTAAAIRLGGTTIILPALPNCIELLAARELQTELAALSGLPPAPVLREPQPPNTAGGQQQPRIYVGRTARWLARLGHLSPLLPEEAAVVGDGADLFVYGDDLGAPNATNASVCNGCVNAQRGAAACCWNDGGGLCRIGSFTAATLLLREHLDMRWVWPGTDGIVRPAVPNPHLNVSATVSSRSAPQLAMRRIRHQHPADAKFLKPGWLNTSIVAEYGVQEAAWMIRNGLGGRKVFLGGSTPWDWKRNGLSHPEWFGLQADGTRGCQNDHSGTCTSHNLAKADAAGSPGLVRYVAGLYNQSRSVGVSACESDSDLGFCTCAKCKALDPPERNGSLSGSKSDRYAYLWNSIHRQLRNNGHPDAWVAGYAYDEYTDAPLRQRFDNASKILIQSVGFDSILDYSSVTTVVAMSTAASRAAWLGWVNAGGSRRMALRPNSIWREYSGLPFVFSNQWLLDVQWCARHGLIAADFDALTGDWQAVGPSYYALARLLWNPSTLSIPDILTEYYSAFGGAADAMRRYYTFWQQHLQAVNTDPAVLQRMQEVAVTRSQYVLAGQTYNAGILTTAAALLAHAQATCGSTAQSPSCVRVGKAATQLEYTRRVAAAASATAAVIRPQTDADNQWTEPVGSNVTVPAGAIVHAGRALQRMATDIAGHSITNVYYTLGYANQRGDLLGLLATAEAPSTNAHLQASAMLPLLGWRVALDSSFSGQSGGLSRGWFRQSFDRTAWAVGHIGCIESSTKPFPSGCDNAVLGDYAQCHNGSTYSGWSWWAVSGPNLLGGDNGTNTKTNTNTNASTRSTLAGLGNEAASGTKTGSLGDDDRLPLLLFMRDGGGATTVRVWLNGVVLGGCGSATQCAQPLLLPLPSHGLRGQEEEEEEDVLVLAVNTTAPGRLRRVFVVRREAEDGDDGAAGGAVGN